MIQIIKDYSILVLLIISGTLYYLFNRSQSNLKAEIRNRLDEHLIKKTAETHKARIEAQKRYDKLKQIIKGG